MTREELLKKLADGYQDVLDEIVHEVASGVASDVNNEGWEAQVDYLLSNGWTLENITERVDREDAAADELDQVLCSVCTRDTTASTAHLHQGKYIGECCWDERLRASE